MLTPTTLLSLKQLSQRYPALSERLLRHWIQTDCDGFRERCTIKIQHRRFIDADEVAAWLEDHRGAPARASPRVCTA
jgi:hypothetical protein